MFQRQTYPTFRKHVIFIYVRSTGIWMISLWVNASEVFDGNSAKSTQGRGLRVTRGGIDGERLY